MTSTLDTLAKIVQQALALHAPFVAASIPVLLEQPAKRGDGGDPERQISNDVQAALAAIGAYIRVRQIVVTDNKAEGPLLFPVGEIALECIEDPSINLTGWSQNALATEVLRRLSGFALPQHIGGTLNNGRIATEVENDGNVNHIALFSFNFQLDTPERCQPVRIAINGTTGAITLSCATEGASIYFLDKAADAIGDYPTEDNGTLYTSPFTVASGHVVYAAAWLTGLAPSDVASCRILVQAITALNPTVDTPTADGATLHWDDVGVNSVQVQVRKADDPDWTTPLINLATTGNSYVITGLPWHYPGYLARVKIASTPWEEVGFDQLPDITPVIGPQPLNIAAGQQGQPQINSPEATPLVWYLDGVVQNSGQPTDQLTIGGLSLGSYLLKARIETAAGNGPWSNTIDVFQHD